MKRRTALAFTGTLATLAVGGGLAWKTFFGFPSDTTPEGAYLRIARSIGRGDPRACFAYLEDRAQHAAYTIRDYRKKARDRVAEAYPEPERGRLVAAYSAAADAPDGADVWVEMAMRLGWVSRLRRDLSGMAKVEVAGERATIETARGTRYPFRRRENGIWGMSLFTAELVAEAERAARDWDVVEDAALDYERAR
ncbi:hypothetical protein [Chondromyces apiculatus]|uniref:Uncharacterized protein n=1 Tax=Chondromyces apiculatus DSM 436 TaxID=1192034 RepID=A0A017T252_9BACT|nr:hypothetical protein [Chondromyces apiculatus]EYF03349.1 Hypothetical protein CAP_5681 [Chondromyces apiculatus DSM 436]